MEVRRVASLRIAVVSLMVGMLSLAGCTGGSSESEAVTPDVTGFGEVIATAIDGATNGGGSDAQLAILEDARMRGEVTFEQARAAVRSTIECLTGLGFNAEYDEQTGPAGLAVPGYRVQTDQGPGGNSDNDPAFQASQQCEVRESFWVNQVYQTQPTSVQANVDYINNVLEPQLRQCLTDSGYEVADDASGVDIVRQAMNLQVEEGASLECFNIAEIPNF